MTRYLAWCRKEAREHRVVLLVLLGAIVLLCALPYVFAKWELRRRAVDLMPAGALTLAAAVLGLDLFAREVHRGTLALVLRTPGAARAAFLGKWTWFLGALLLCFLAAQGTCWAGTAITGAPFARVPVREFDGTWSLRDRDLSPLFVFGVSLELLLPLVALAVGAWHVVGSLWTRRGGASALVGFLTFALLALPMGLLFLHHEWWFAFPPRETLAFVALLGLGALAVAALSWGIGRRFLAPARRAFLVGAGAAALGAALFTGGVAWAIDRWEAEDPWADGFGIQAAYLGEGSRQLFLTTYRGVPWSRWGTNPQRGTPLRLRSIDLTGTGERYPMERNRYLGEGAADETGFLPTLLTQGSLPAFLAPQVPVPWIARFTSAGSVLMDARTGEDTAHRIPRFGATDLRPLLPYLVSMARAVSTYRDGNGHRVWPVAGVTVDVEPGVSLADLDLERRWPAWRGFLWDGWILEDEARRRTYVDPATGATIDLGAVPAYPFSEQARRVSWSTVEVDGDVYLQHGSYRLDEPDVDLPWILGRRTTGERRRASEVPDLPLGLEAVASLGRGTVLLSGAEGLGLWRPATGQRVALRFEPSSSERPLAFNGHVQRLGGGTWLLTMASALDPIQARWAIGVLDEATGVVGRRTPWLEDYPRLVALEPDGGTVLIEDDRRVVRYRGLEERTLLYPRPR